MNPQSHAICEVSINETTGVERLNQPIFTGIPFPQGTFQPHQAGWLTLANADTTAGILATPAAYWPDGSIKWLHLSGILDRLTPGRQTSFSLLPAKTAPAPAITAHASPTQIQINTSLLAVTIDLAQSSLLKVSLNNADMFTGPGLSASLTPGTPDGGRAAPIAWVPQADSLSLVVQTENRAVARMTGFFTRDDKPLAEMILFIEVLQGLPELRLQPVLIYLGDSDKDTIADFTFTAHTALGHPNGKYALGRQRGSGHWDTSQNVGPDNERALAQAAQPQKPENFTPNAGGPRFPIARILQTGSSFYTLEKRTTPTNTWVKIAEGQRNPGWVHLAHPTLGGITAAMRYFWQEYPRSLALNSDDGTLTYGLVPPDGQILTFKRYSDYKWGASVYETGRGLFNASFHGAYGIAKSSELLLRFEPSIPREVAKTGLFWANPLTVLPTPAQVADSRVFGSIAAAPAKGFEPLEANLAKLLDFIIAERDYRGWYGLLNFGDVLMSYYADKDRWAFDDGGYAWINTEALPDHALWMSALRSGRHDWLQASIEMTRHNRDVDIYHRGNFKGTGTRHNVQHWGDADKEWRISMPITQRLHYFLTGDPWTREVMLDTIAVYQSYDRTSRLAPSMSSALQGLMVKHELTGSPADGKAARTMLDLYAKAIGPDGHFANQLKVNLATGEGEVVQDGKNLLGSYFFLLNFGCQHTLAMGQESYRSEELLQGIIRYCEMCLVYKPTMEAYMVPQTHASLVFFAMAYKATGDEKFADALRKHARPSDVLELGILGSDDPLDEPPHLALIKAKRINKIVCWLGELANLFPYAFKALEK